MGADAGFRIEADLDSQQRRVFGTQELLQLLKPHRKKWGF